MCSPAVLPALLSLLLLLLARAAVASEGDSRVARAAKTCCPLATVACCEKAIEFNLPLQCEEELSTDEVVKINKCIQRELFTDKSLAMVNIEDSVCCSVFARDQNDQEGRCATRCIRALSTPGWSAKQKRHAIRDCKKSNDLYECFDNCRWNRRVLPGTLTIETECTLSKSIGDGEILIGEKIFKRI